MENYNIGRNINELNYLSKNYVNAINNMSSVNTSSENVYNHLIKYIPKGGHIGNYGPLK